MNPHLLLILASFCASVFLAALLFMIARPTSWAAFVERENDFWVRRRLLPRRIAEKIKVVEKRKLTFVAGLVICVVSIWLLLHTPLRQPKFRAMPPPAPAPRRQLTH